MASINKTTEVEYPDIMTSTFKSTRQMNSEYSIPSLQLPSVNNYFHQPWNYINYISQHHPPVAPVSSSSVTATTEPSSLPSESSTLPSVVTPSMFPNIYSTLPSTEKVSEQGLMKPVIPSMFPYSYSTLPVSTRNEANHTEEDTRKANTGKVASQESPKQQPSPAMPPHLFPNIYFDQPSSLSNGVNLPGIGYQQHLLEATRKPTTPEKDMNDSGNSSGLSSTSSPSSESASSTSSSPSLSHDNVIADENRTRKNTRTNYSPKQVKYLEQVFLQTPYPEAEVLEQISRDFNIPEKNLRIWFQNKRARYRKRVQSNGRTAPTGYPMAPHTYGMMTPLMPMMSNRPVFHSQPPLGQVPSIPYPYPYPLAHYK